jgi:hypothetical protein
LDECPGFSELLLKEGSIIGMAPIAVHLKSLGHKLKFMTESFRQNARVPLRIRNLPPGECRSRQ